MMPHADSPAASCVKFMELMTDKQRRHERLEALKLTAADRLALIAQGVRWNVGRILPALRQKPSRESVAKLQAAFDEYMAIPEEERRWGDGRRIADKHGVRYQTLLNKIFWARNPGRKAEYNRRHKAKYHGGKAA